MPSRTPTHTPKPIDSPTHRPSATPTFTRQPSFTPTNTAAPTQTVLITSTPTFISSATVPPTLSQTPSHTPTRTSAPTVSPIRTKTLSPTATRTQTSTYTPTNTSTPSRTATSSQTPTHTVTRTFTPTNTPSRTHTSKPSATPTSTHTPTATLSPTRTPSLRPSSTFTPTPSSVPPTLIWAHNLPDLKLILNRPEYEILDIDDYWYATTPLSETMRWGVSSTGHSFGVQVDSENRLSITKPDRVGTYQFILQGNNGTNVLRTRISLKISHFLFRIPHWQPAILLQPNERYRSPVSLYSCIDPPNVSREQIHFDFSSSLPAGVKSARIDSEGHLWIEADNSTSVDLSKLAIKAGYVSPTPTPSPTPTRYIPPPTPTRAPEITLNACARPIRFRQVHTEEVGRDPISLYTIDLNRDDRPDWITADFGENTATVLLSGGDNLAYQRQRLYTGEGCLAVELGDWNQDGWTDAALLGGYDSVLTIYHGQQGNEFTKAADIPLQPDPLLPPERMEKGKLRIMASGHFVPNRPPCLLVALVNQLVCYECQNNRWTESERWILESPPLDLLPLDSDGDGIHELAMTFNAPSRFCFFKHSTGGWREQKIFDLDSPLHGNYAQTVLAARLNSDAFDDSALITFDSTLCTFMGGGLLQQGIVRASESPIVIHDLIAGDFDGEGNTDLMWMGFDVQRQKIVLNLLCGNSSGFSQDTASAELPWPYRLSQKYSLTSCDFDADGRLDLVLSDALNNRLIFMKNLPVH